MTKSLLPFEFAVGIECTMIADERPAANPPLRRLDEFELMKHYEKWREDLELVARLQSGNRRVSKLRWCFPWYRMEREPGKIDFEWCDRVVEYANELGIELVPDVVHYGTPLWLENAFLHRDYPERVAAFAGACAERYKGRVKFYTPLNEPHMTGVFSAQRGEWPPYEKSQKAYVEVLVQLAIGMQKTVQAIKAADSSAQCWAVEVTNNYKALNEEAVEHCERAYRRDLIVWDLVHGLVNESHENYSWLLEQGAAEAQLKRLLQNPSKMDLLGLNFYPWSSFTYEWKDGRIVQGEDWDGRLLYDVIRHAYKHSGADLFITETSAHGTGGKKSSTVTLNAIDMRIQWMDETLEAVARARAENLPVLGYTQFPLYTMVDWAYRPDNAPPEDWFISLGMIEIDAPAYTRRWTPVADRFLQHLTTFEQTVCAS